jgi:hypothetical protein
VAATGGALLSDPVAPRPRAFSGESANPYAVYQGFATAFTIGWYCRHGSLRRLGHGGRGVGTSTPGTTGRMRLDGMDREKAIETVAVPSGTVLLNDHIG